MLFSSTIALEAQTNLKTSNYITLKTEETTATVPKGYKEGLPLYLRPTDENDNDLGQFLICTSCTISYMFGTIPSGVTPTKVYVRDHLVMGDHLDD